ncbi:ankyrin repeat domain-containing protein [Parachlamydia sp. AcF125]|uniref:ankyrin repeat domain-containing protein n=1 Tax=Parachlamydia sp. AcF125 TaxID=2795736 RepID=UPI001BC9FC54|nr:ankyrin repeat domain-containing protein [Parachlamydia sp. AcF125]MBS4168609.1 hypothetical protein [Parachlamydia sp. AcF125]
MAATKAPQLHKNLIVQGYKFLREAKKEASLHGFFYLSTAYELYFAFNMREYRFDRETLDEYPGSLEKRGENLIYYFAARPYLNILMYLFAGSQNIKSRRGVLAGKATKEMPLHFANKSGSMPIMQFLLNQNADVKKLDSSQYNALNYACRSLNNRIDIIHILLRYHPILVEAKNGGKQAPLPLVVFAGNERSVEYLLDYIKLRRRILEGVTSSHFSMLYGL